MKYLKLFESTTEIKIAKICEEYGIKNWSINKDGLVDVDDNVYLNYLSYKNLTRFPLQFGRVTGNFYCHNNKLTTLQGAPKKVDGDFSCSYNNLTTLEGGPKEIGGSFYCHNNLLTTLEGGPKEVDGNFHCHRNKLTTLEGSPTEVNGNFICEFNNLTTLEGGPKEVGGDFKCQYNELTTLEGAPREVSGGFYCQYNNLTTLKSAPEYVGSEVIFIPNKDLPMEFLNFLRLNEYEWIRSSSWMVPRVSIEKYIFKWQKDYAVWRRDGSFNQANFIQMMEAAQDELKIKIKFPNEIH